MGTDHVVVESLPKNPIMGTDAVFQYAILKSMKEIQANKNSVGWVLLLIGLMILMTFRNWLGLIIFVVCFPFAGKLIKMIESDKEMYKETPNPRRKKIMYTTIFICIFLFLILVAIFQDQFQAGIEYLYRSLHIDPTTALDSIRNFFRIKIPQ